MSNKGSLSLNEVNNLPTESFEWLFSNVIEHSPEVTKFLVLKRPFLSVDHLKKLFDDYIDQLDDFGKISYSLLKKL